ncbi:hypothetical protein T09_15416 [Trichinella sp. T9]|nr:hypothetical protein T09_15416 [Trichinella sp. T9]
MGSWALYDKCTIELNDTSENGRSATELQRNGTEPMLDVDSRHAKCCIYNWSSDSDRHLRLFFVVKLSWDTLVVLIIDHCQRLRNLENGILNENRLYPQTQVAIVLPSISCIGLAAPCNLRPELALSHNRLEIIETIASLSSYNKIFKLYILSVTGSTLPVSGLMVAIALLSPVRFQTRSWGSHVCAGPGSRR